MFHNLRSDLGRCAWIAASSMLVLGEAAGAQLPKESVELWRQALTDYRPGADDLFVLYGGAPALPAASSVIAGTIETADREDCALNPPIRIVASGAEQTIENGNSVLRVPPGGKAVAVLGIEVEEEKEESSSDSQPSLFIVFDEIEMSAGKAVATEGQADRIYNISADEDGITLTPRSNGYSVCRTSRPAGPRAVAIVRSQTAQPSLWLSRVKRAHLLDSVGLDATKSYTSSALANGYYDFRLSTNLGTSHLAVGEVESATIAWRARFNAARGAWVECRPLAIGGNALTCGGARVTLDSFQAPVATTTGIFDKRKFLRLWLDTVPSGASIFLGTARHSPLTNTKMDVASRRVREIRLEKAGYKPCPYGPRWVLMRVDGPRPGIKATCTLVRQ